MADRMGGVSKVELAMTQLDRAGLVHAKAGAIRESPRAERTE